MLTLETTWMIQLAPYEAGDDWSWYSQQEWTDRGKCCESASRMYGGEVEMRLVRVDRTVEAL